MGVTSKLLRATHAESPVWPVASQALQSLSSVLLTILVARSASPEVFGAWTICFALTQLFMILIRNGMGTVLLTADATEAAMIRSQMTGLALLAGCAVALAAAPMMLIGSLAPFLWAFLLSLPHLACLEMTRSACFKAGRGRTIATVDGLSLVAFATLMALSGGIFQSGPLGTTVAWCLAALSAAGAGLTLARIRPTLKDATKLWVTSRKTIAALTFDQLLVSGRSQVTPIFLAMVAGYSATASLRSGMIFVGIINMVIGGLMPLAIMRAADTQEHGPRQVFALWGAVIAAIGIINLATTLSLPHAAGQALLGANWEGARSVLLPLGLYVVAQGYASGASVVFRGRRELRRLARNRIWSEPMQLALPLLGVVLAGSQGAAWGFLGAALWAGVVGYVHVSGLARVSAFMGSRLRAGSHDEYRGD